MSEQWKQYVQLQLEKKTFAHNKGWLSHKIHTQGHQVVSTCPYASKEKYVRFQ